MKSIRLLLVLTALGLYASPGNAWNTGKHLVNWVQYENNGRILFTLYEGGNSGDSLQCDAAGKVRFRIEPCGTTGTECIAATNRMASALLAAKVSGKSVHVQNSDCLVTQVAIDG